MSSPKNTACAESAFDVERARQDFPILSQLIRGKPLAYLDNAATSQRPEIVVDSIRRFHRELNANVHRGVHYLSERATAAYEGARETIRGFIGAADTREIIFLRGTTEAINLVAFSYGNMAIGKDDEIIVSHLEHHSNIVPWQMLCERVGAKLLVIPMFDNGELDLEAYEALLSPRTKMVALAHVSNALGTVVPVREMTAMAHAHGAKVLLDGAQSIPHLHVDVQDLDCDFYAFSGHKIYGPTGIGVLYGKRELLEAMPPWQGGGDMIASVTFERSTYNELPYKFEAGTPNMAGGVGLGTALEYVQGLGLPAIAAHEAALLDYATARLADIKGLRIVGTAADKASVVSFVIQGVHPHDIGTMLDLDGIAVRAGHHCTQPLMDRLGLPATARASFAFYNTFAEIDRLAEAIPRITDVFC
ncbi:MAG: cysteine desulfurase/selenocysteine lyase [Rhodothermales bacterium]|jgi:cysteine desulfurase/selenocysteine lyase